MTATTPTYGWPYPEPSDARGAGANAIRDLALAQERTVTELAADTAVRWATATGPGSAALGDGAWTTVTYAAMDSSPGVAGNGGAGSNKFTVTDGPRWFLVSFGANVAVNGTQPSAGLRLMVSGAVAANLAHSDNYGNLSAAIPFLLSTGQDVYVDALAEDGSGNLGGATDSAYLRLVSLPST